MRLAQLRDYKGKIALIYLHDIDPIRLEKTYAIYFVDNGQGEPLRVDEFPELVGKTIAVSDNHFETEVGYRWLRGQFLDAEIVREKISLRDLGLDHRLHRERIDWLKSRGFLILESLDFTRYKVRPTIKFANAILSSNTLDELYEKDPKLADAFYNVMYRKLGDFEELPPWTGVALVSKEGLIQWEVER